MEIPRTPDLGLALRRTAAAAVLLLGGNAVLFDDQGSEAQAAAVTFGGVEVVGINCTPATARGVNLRNIAPDVRFIERYDPSTGAVLNGLTLGSGDDGRINAPETSVGEDQPAYLRAKAQGGAIVGATQVIMDCLQNDPSTTTSNSVSTSSTVRVTTTTSGLNTSTTTTAGPNISTTSTTVSSSQPKTTILSITNPSETNTTVPANPANPPEQRSPARYIALTG